MTAVRARLESGLSLAAFGSLTETRVWGVNAENPTRAGAWQRLSSTSQWGCGYRCDRTASELLVGLDYANQRYHATGFGIFTTADPYRASAGTTEPATWNRYTYVHGDPINFYDPSGNNEAAPGDNGSGPCGPNWMTDPSLVGPCEGGGGGGIGGVGGLGGGGGGGGYGGDDFLGKDETDARNDLAKPKCFALFGFTSAKGAQSAFDGLTFHIGNYGKLKLVDGVPSSDPSDPAAAFTIGFGQINLNNDYNWSDFSKVATQQGGTYDFLAFNNRAYGTKMDSEQLGTLIILHEIGHQRTVPKQPSDAEDAAERLAIFNNCIK